MPTIRRDTPADHPALHAIWRRSVEATHHFLTMPEIDALAPMVEQLLGSGALTVWVLVSAEGEHIGWMGMDGAKLEALFLDPDRRRQGHGRRLVEHATRLHGTVMLDVNEQNSDAVRFYEAMGFTVTGRSPLDGQGKPFPLLHMWRKG